ncbi:MAG: DUF2262 domain-containing protein [Oscillospiraceae bacterium]|nr:DUF2262 domain-containing protein [Oscillospiraceae bacterium]
MFDSLKKKKSERPVVENELGKFTLRCFENTPVNWYCGEAVWYGAEDSILAYVSCDGKRTVRADKGFAKLSETVKNSIALDARLREYAMDFAISKFGVNGVIAVLNDGTAGTVTYDEFAERIEVEFVEVHGNGSLSFDIWLDGMFADDSLVIGMDKDGNITGCELQV